MTNLDAHPDVELLEPGQPCTALEVLEPRVVPLGGPRAMTVYRALPAKGRPMVGSWCFLDHYGPDDASLTGGMSVPRHPHTGLATVSWLFSGTIDHLDSGGNAAQVVPGELNLMIAGSGITHQEIMDISTTVLHGVQLWYAMPDETRFAANRFANYAPSPVQHGELTAHVFIGDMFGSTSPVETLTPELLGAELRIPGGTVHSIELRHDFEYALLAEDGPIWVNGIEVPHRGVGVVPTGSTVLELVAGPNTSRVILLGGVPLGESIVMWWNFIGRTHEEIVEYRARYQWEMGFDPLPSTLDESITLFGPYPEGQPAPLPAPDMPQVRLRERSNTPAKTKPVNAPPTKPTTH